MSIAIDTNVLVRLLVRDDALQLRIASDLLREAEAAGESVVILIGTLMATEWVLRSRYQFDKTSIFSAFSRLLESRDVAFEHEATVEEALYLWNRHPGADFTDCLLNARAAHLGCSRFLTFDVRAARLPGAELLS